MTTTTAQSAAWPDGVIARYLAVAGATVDIRDIGIDRQTSVSTVTDITITAHCQGCRQKDVSTYLEMDASTLGGDFLASSLCGDAREWAQAHAEKCRALPRPAV